MLTNRNITELFGIPKTTLHNWKKYGKNDWRFKMYSYLILLDKEILKNRLDYIDDTILSSLKMEERIREEERKMTLSLIASSENQSKIDKQLHKEADTIEGIECSQNMMAEDLIKGDYKILKAREDKKANLIINRKRNRINTNTTTNSKLANV